MPGPGARKRAALSGIRGGNAFLVSGARAGRPMQKSASVIWQEIVGACYPFDFSLALALSLMGTVGLSSHPLFPTPHEMSS